MATTHRSFAQSVWDFFCSLKLTIFLLISLALTSIIGTVLPQGQLAPEYVASISALKLQIYSKLGFFDMYHSWWFIALLYVFSLNLTACSIKRLPHVFKFISEPMLVLGDSLRNSFPLKHHVTFSGSLESGRDALAAFLKSEVAAPVVTEHNGEYHLFAQKNAWCRLGVYVVHLSILVIFVGAIIGSLFGYKGFVAIVEGTGASTIQTRSGMPMPLGFELRCEKFNVDFYPTGAPKEFRSILTVLENGKPVPGYKDVKVIVNKPLSYKGITFYQSSYGQSNEGSEHSLTVTARSGGNEQHITMHEGEQVPLKDGSTLKLLESTQEVRQFMPEYSGPAARIELTPRGKAPQTFIVMKNFPDLSAQRGDELIVHYEGTDAKMYTGLQVAKDPGVWVVWLGCLLMVVGLFIAFFMSHKRVWIIVSKGQVRMYGNASKNQAAFQMQFDDLTGKLNDLKI
ncbi:cytochrome c biogenesis protein ResB [Geobacter sp. SVR]|uniref:cytochrome c biogenesis protein ResB n=1 Tax=Geobacter sp. SVR TaxID=2495594 RepID=UPI00143F0210|nr:cytochrome c biogenesis protein ResB [Geobacter sp. SVR]BCS55094.1 cytochrome c biogenesis protein ResB [Geobacter sp. SVR]GCF85275.1 cytochrome c biogenesis protein ResB [Geobacter sp. SVR]